MFERVSVAKKWTRMVGWGERRDHSLKLYVLMVVLLEVFHNIQIADA